MSSGIRRLRAQRVISDAAAYAYARASLENTLARRAEAQRVLDEISREAAVSEDVTCTLAARLDESRYALIGVCVEELPDDILRCVYEKLVCDHDDYAPPQTPFILAAVCARWRRVALSSPRIWSNIHVFPMRHSGPSFTAADHARVMTLLSRSRAAPLRISVHWPTNPEDTPSDEVDVFNDILTALQAHALRWARIVVMHLPHMVERSMLDCLKGPTPMLEHMNLILRPRTPDSMLLSEEGFLPFTPKLRELVLTNVGTDCSTISAFPALEILRLYESSSTEQVLYDYITRAPSLVELNVAIPITRAPYALIALSNLVTLRIGQGAQSFILEPVSTCLEMPKLAKLYVDCALDDRMQAFFDAVSPTVRVLSINQRLMAEHLPLVRRLQNVETLDLSEQPIDNAALDQLASADAPIWLRLRVLRFIAYTNESSMHILRLVAARNVGSSGSTAERDTAEARPCKIVAVGMTSRFDQPEAPSWLLHELERLLRL